VGLNRYGRQWPPAPVQRPRPAPPPEPFPWRKEDCPSCLALRDGLGRVRTHV
jgi:hypothetical protein